MGFLQEGTVTFFVTDTNLNPPLAPGGNKKEKDLFKKK